LEAVHAIDHGILAGENLEAIGDASLVALRELIPCAGCSVTLFNLQNGEAALLASAPGRDSSAANEMGWVPLDRFDATIQALHREEIYIPDRDLGLPLPASVLGSSDTPESKTYALVPLRCEGELLGSLNLALEQSDRPTSLHKSILRQVADSLTVAVRNAQLKTAVTDLAEQLQALGANRAGPHET
jgi:GAF domain-containing protein